MTVPVGLATALFLPDTPYTTRAWFLSKEECELSIERVVKAGKAPPVKITWKTFARILSRWRWYAFVLGYVVSLILGPAPSNAEKCADFHLPLKAVRLGMPGEQLFRNLAQVGELFGRGSEHHSYWDESHISYLCGSLGFLV